MFFRKSLQRLFSFYAKFTSALIMKFWNKNYSEMTVKELTIWSVSLSVIAYAIMWVATTTDFFETVCAKITGIWNKIFRK